MLCKQADDKTPTHHHSLLNEKEFNLITNHKLLIVKRQIDFFMFNMNTILFIIIYILLSQFLL